MTEFTADDLAWLWMEGVAAGDGRVEAEVRPGMWAPERVLRLVAQGRIQVCDYRVLIDDDGVPSSVECAALSDLLDTGHLAWIGWAEALVITARGRELLARWSRLHPLNGGGR